jgi:hypothetical protein
MTSKQVTEKLRIAVASLAALNAHQQKIGSKAGEFLRPHLKEGEVMPDMALLTTLLIRALESVRDELEQAEKKHNLELGQDLVARAVRDEKIEPLFASMGTLRQLLGVLIGPDAVRQAGFASDTPRDPMGLQRAAEAVAEKLRAGKFETGLPGTFFDAVEWATRLENESRELAEAIGEVAREARETQGTLSEKYQAMERFDERFSIINQLAKSLLLMAGEELLAAKMSYSRGSSRAEAEPAPRPITEGPAEPPSPAPADG